MTSRIPSIPGRRLKIERLGLGWGGAGAARGLGAGRGAGRWRVTGVVGSVEGRRRVASVWSAPSARVGTSPAGIGGSRPAMPVRRAVESSRAVE